MFFYKNLIVPRQRFPVKIKATKIKMFSENFFKNVIFSKIRYATFGIIATHDIRPNSILFGSCL